jgi:hypothetical protein
MKQPASAVPDAAGASVVVPLGGAVHPAVVAACAAVLSVVLLENRGLAWIAVPVALAAALVAAAATYQGKLRIGEDGLTLNRPFRGRFVPIDDVRDVEIWFEQSTGKSGAVSTRLQGLVVTRLSGKPVYLRMYGRNPGAVEAKERILAAVRDARLRRTPALEALARGGRTVEAWHEDLRTLFARGGGFRDQALRQEDALEVLDDPTASVEQRLGAAVALRATGAAPANERIRVAAEASAKPRVRVALEKIAAEEDVIGELEAALEEEQARARA